MGSGYRSRVEEMQEQYWRRDKSCRRRPDHPVVAAAFDPLASIVASVVESPRDSTVLDVGCGNGFLSWALEKRFGKVVGLDFSEEMLRVNPCQNKVLGTSTDLPFPNRSFDVAVASHLLHHLAANDRVETLREMGRVARAAVVCFEPNRNNPLVFLFSLLKGEERMALRFSRAYMRSLCASACVVPTTIFNQNWIAPNRAPTWWIKVGRLLARSALQRFGLDICCIAMLTDGPS